MYLIVINKNPAITPQRKHVKFCLPVAATEQHFVRSANTNVVSKIADASRKLRIYLFFVGLNWISLQRFIIIIIFTAITTIMLSAHCSLLVAQAHLYHQLKIPSHLQLWLPHMVRNRTICPMHRHNMDASLSNTRRHSSHTQTFSARHFIRIFAIIQLLLLLYSHHKFNYYY